MDIIKICLPFNNIFFVEDADHDLCRCYIRKSACSCKTCITKFLKIPTLLAGICYMQNNQLLEKVSKTGQLTVHCAATVEALKNWDVSWGSGRAPTGRGLGGRLLSGNFLANIWVQICAIWQ